MNIKSARKRLTRMVRGLQLRIRRLLYEEVLVLGDSHSRVFHDRGLRRRFGRHFFHVFNVGGATASGLANPMSKTQAYQIFQGAIEGTRARRVIVMLGEVDTGYVIWYRAQKYNEQVAVMLERAVATYSDFINQLIGRSFEVICISTPLPTIADGVVNGEVAEARREIKATQRERTALTLEFNRRMAAFCAETGALHLNVDGESMGSDGLIRPDLLNPNPADHHYHRPAHAQLLLPHLLRVLEAARG